jgi:membrane protein YqaA with SNARE-associated domain
MHLVLAIAHALGTLVRSMGLVGLFALTLFDGSLLWLLPGINDILVISLVIAKRTVPWAAATALVATAGSLLGATFLYKMVRRGGGDFVRKRFPPALLGRIETWTSRMGAIPVGVAAVLPPPCPYAPFVFSASIMRVPLGRFQFSVALGRGVRYGLEAALALYLGRHLLSRLPEIYWDVLEPALIAAVLLAVVWALLRLQFSRSRDDFRIW